MTKGPRKTVKMKPWSSHRSIGSYSKLFRDMGLFGANSVKVERCIPDVRCDARARPCARAHETASRGFFNDANRFSRSSILRLMRYSGRGKQRGHHDYRHGCVRSRWCRNPPPVRTQWRLRRDVPRRGESAKTISSTLQLAFEPGSGRAATEQTRG